MKHRKNESVAVAAAKSGFSAATGYRINRSLRHPAPEKPPRGRRRPDPLDGIFEKELVPLLEKNSAIRSVGLFKELMKRHPELNRSVRRTLERRVRDWRAKHGPDQDVMFRQKPVPGRIGLSDFTRMNALDVTIAGEPLNHMLYHFRLPWSGFRHAEVVLGGESFTALASGLQAALRSVGGAPADHRTDSLSAGFRNRNKDDAEDMSERYRQLCHHYGMTPSRNNRGIAHENGAIESPHGHLKREIADALALRETKDFADVLAYRTFIAEIVERGNADHNKNITAERCELRKLPPMGTADYEETSVCVTSSSGFILKRVFYTVPSRLIGHRLGVRLYDDRLDLFVGGIHQLTLPRKRRGASTTAVHVVNYRHVIHSLKTKPMALMNLAYRDEIFPRQAFRSCFEMAVSKLDERDACRLTVKLLALAHEENCEAMLATEIDHCLQAGQLPDLDGLKARFAPDPGNMPEVCVSRPQLAGYEGLLGAGGAS